MATIKIENLSRAAALQLLKNVQKNHAKGLAIQGRQECRYIYTNTVNATVKVEETESGANFANNTFEIHSGYWMESTLNEFIQD